MKTSDAFKDGEPPEDAEDPEAEAAKLKFPWHCEKGVVENARMLNDEFNAVRQLNPVKIFVSGPPASGKTYYSKMVSDYYNIPRVHVKELTDKAYEMAAPEEPEEGLASDIKAKIDELKQEEADKLQEKYDGMDWGDGEAPEIDKDSLPIRLPDDIIQNILKIRLNDNDCRNRGYILDGYPRTHENAQHLFLIKEKKFDPETGEEIEEEEPELEEGQKKTFEGYIPDKSIIPFSCMILKQEDSFLMNRVKRLKEKDINGTHYNAADMKRRLAAYREANENKVAEPSL